MVHSPSSKIEASVGLLTVSDTRSEHDDRSGALARRLFEEAGHRVVAYEIRPDESEQVRELLLVWVSDPTIDVVVINGGTGISRRDRTFEALDGLLDQPLDGFGELFRALSYEQIGSAAMLSRALGGIVRGRPVFSLPGSPRAVELGLTRLILPELSHLLSEIRK